MNADEATATAWVDGVIETLYESFKAGKGVTFPGFGGFYVRPSLKAGSSSSIQASDCERFLAGHRRTRANSRHA
jgi:nucleoid DNA-binding protein